MRHNVAGRLFGRTANQRKALLRGLVGALIENERIETTVAKAKETRRLVEKLVTLGKRGDVHAKRVAMSKLPNRPLIVKLFNNIAPRFADRNGGYTRIVMTRQRVNDRSEMAVLEFVDFEENRAQAAGPKGEKAEKGKKKAAPKKKTPAKKAEEKKPAEETTEETTEKKAASKKTTTKKTAAKKTAEKKTAGKKTTTKKTAAKKKAASKKTTTKKTTAKKTATKKKTEKE